MTNDTRDALLNAARRIDERCAMDGEGPIERFERLAKLFRRETGFTAPGKDMLTLSFADEDYERRQMEAWDAWNKAPLDDLRAALRTPRPESDARDAARMQAIAAHPGWLRYLSSGARKGKWAFHAPTTNYEYDVFDTPQAAIDAALTQPEATR